MNQKFLEDASFKEIEEKIKESRDSYESLGYFIDETFRVIERYPFNEKSIEFLLKEGLTCKTEGFIFSTYNQDEKVINLNKELISEGKYYDFYKRDIHLMHELNHAWYNQFEVVFQKCLTDKPGTIHEEENRLMNEYFSRKNRAKPWILKKAVEGFGLEPQIYDLVSKMAFEDNPRAKISPLVKKNNNLLKIVFVDGHKSHYEFSKQF